MTANTNSIIVDDLESFSTNKLYLNPNGLELSEHKLYDIQTEILQQAYQTTIKNDEELSKHT
jgi:hypothetical protein